MLPFNDDMQLHVLCSHALGQVQLEAHVESVRLRTERGGDIH